MPRIHHSAFRRPFPPPRRTRPRRDRTGRSRRSARPGHHRVRAHLPGSGGVHLGRLRRRGDRDAGQRALDVGAHLGGGLVALGRVLGHRLQHDGVGPGRDLRVDARRRDRVLPDVLVGDGDRGVPGERGPAGEQFVQQAPGRVQVAARVHPLAAGLLGRQVLRGPDHLGGLGHGGLGVADGAGDAEVHHLDLGRPGQHHVAGLDVPVHDPVPVAVVQRPQHPVGDLQRPLGEQAPVVAEQFAQGPAVHVLHHDVRDVRRPGHVLAGVVDGDDGRVVQRGRGLGLPPEPGLEGRVPGQVLAERLHRDDPVEADVPGPVHLGHAAPADDAVEFVAAAEEPWLCHVSHVSNRPASLSVHRAPRWPRLMPLPRAGGQSSASRRLP